MITFAELQALAPAVADPIKGRLDATHLALLGTVRKDGSPRVSPVEVSFQDGGLYVGMMPRSFKALDLRRDPRFSLLTPVADKDDVQGEGKLFGTAVEVTDPAEIRRRVLAALESAGYEVGDADFGDSHMFELRIEAAAWQKVIDDAFTTTSWREGGEVRYRRRVGADGLPEDVSGGF